MLILSLKYEFKKQQLGNHVTYFICICDFQNEQNQKFMLGFVEERLLLGLVFFSPFAVCEAEWGRWALNLAGSLWVLVLPIFDVQ